MQLASAEQARPDRDLVVLPWVSTAERIRAEGRKRVYYLSMEFFLGRLCAPARPH